MDCVNQNTNEYPIVGVDAVNRLKQKVICEFDELLKYVEKGYKPNYQFLLEEITFINIITEDKINLDKSLFILQFYNNNKWQIMLY